MRALMHDSLMVISFERFLHDFTSEMIQLILSRGYLFFPENFFSATNILAILFFETTTTNLLSFFFLSVYFTGPPPLFLVATISVVESVAVESVAIVGVVSTTPVVISAASAPITTRVPFPDHVYAICC